MWLQITFRDAFNTHLHTELLQGQVFRASYVIKSTTGNLLNVHPNQIGSSRRSLWPLTCFPHCSSSTMETLSRIFQGIFDFAEEPWLYGLLCQFSICSWSINHSCKYTNLRRHWCWAYSNAVFSLQLSRKISRHSAFHISCAVQILGRGQDISEVAHQHLWESFQKCMWSTG